MCKRRAWTWLRAGFLPLVFSLAAAPSLASCSWFTPGSGGTTSISPGVLVTGQGFVTLLDQQTGKQIWRRQTNVTDFMPLFSNDMVYIVSQNPGGYNPDRTDTLEALSLASGKLMWRWNWPEHWTPENAPTIIDGIAYLSESSLPANANYSPAPLSQYQGIDSFYENWSCEVHRSRGLPMTTTDIYVNERLDHLGIRGRRVPRDRPYILTPSSRRVLEARAEKVVYWTVLKKQSSSQLSCSQAHFR